MSHHGIFTTLLMGVALAEFGLTGLTGPSGDGTSAAARERTTSIARAHNYSAGNSSESSVALIVPQDISAEEYSAAAIKRIMPPATTGGPPAGYQAPRAELAEDINNGVRHLDQSVRQLPGYAMKMVGQVEQHGIAALAYEDPEMKRVGHNIGSEIGMGIRHLMSALGKDMVATAQESNTATRR